MLIWAPYYSFIRVNNSGPDVKNWAVTDTNWQLTSLLFKRFEAHHHNAATPMNYPGYNTIAPATPSTPLLTQSSTGGSLQAGTYVGVRLSFMDQYGLETQACPESAVQMPPVVNRPNAPSVQTPVTTPVPGALPGGTYLYAVTKGLLTSESMISDISTVDVPYDQTGASSYVVPITFDPINSYADGTDSVYLYRTGGFDQNFVLLTTFTATPGLQNAINSYTDNGSVQDLTHQPPQSSQFGNQNSLNISWANIVIPSTAYYFNVYLTQQAGVWGNNHVLYQYSLVSPATPFPTSVVYQGTETLSPGYPLEFSQIPFGSSMINLASEAVGAPYYTQPANAQGWQTWNFVLPRQTNSTPVFGAIYVDDSVGGNGQLKVCLATPSGPGQPGIFSTLANVGSGYAHPLVEAGGHTASHIQGAPNIGGPTQDLINNIIATPVAGPSQRYRKQVEQVYKVLATPADLQLSDVGIWETMVDMNTASQWPTGISPAFPGQWFQVDFQTQVNLQASTSQGNLISAVLAINGVQQPETFSVFGGIHATPTGIIYGNLAFNFSTPLTRPNNAFTIQWMLSQQGYALSYGGNVIGQLPRRYFIINETF